MTKRMLIMLAIVGVVFGAIFGFQIFKAKMIQKVMAGMGAAPQTVATTRAETQEWRSQLQAVGTLRAVKGADLSVEIAGIVEEINFNSGDDVDAGKLLLRLRASDDIARLRALEASADLAQIVYDRDVKQARIQAVSQAQVDSDAANLKNARAQVAAQQATIDKKFIKAPFAGHLGIRAIDLGQYIGPGTMIVTLQALDPIYADFYLPQQALDDIKVGQSVTARIDTYPDEKFTGEISAVNPKVDQATRNVLVRATFKNPDRRMLPGMYTTVEIAVGAPQQYVTLPQTAITFNPYGDTVYIVDEKGTDAEGRKQLAARQTFVNTGARRGDQVAVLSGLKEGETVVTAGQVKLRNGSPVVVNNAVTPSNDPNPKPTDQ
jgi:membrane fusion protein (multidrug efflux system)